MDKKRKLRRIEIEPAKNGHTVTAHFDHNGKKGMNYYDMDGMSEKSVHEDCCGAANKVHELMAEHQGEEKHAVENSEGESEE